MQLDNWVLCKISKNNCEEIVSPQIKQNKKQVLSIDVAGEGQQFQPNQVVPEIQFQPNNNFHA